MARDNYKVGDEPIPGYRLVDRISTTLMSEVWKAEPKNAPVCALKIVRRRRAGRKELRSLDLLKEIHHPFIVAIHGFWLKDRPGPEGRVVEEVDWFDDSGTVDVERGSSKKRERERELVIAMELCDGSLEELLKEDQHPDGVPVHELLRYMKEAAEAIDLVNKHDIQHSDIKPANILLLGNHAKLCDFGIARQIGSNMKTTKSLAATLPYADPIVQAGKDQVPTTDLYCLAITYAELRLGRLLYFDDSDEEEILRAKTNRDFDLGNLPPTERDILMGALAPVEEDRKFRGPKKATDFVEKLSAFWREDYQYGDELDGGIRLQKFLQQDDYCKIWIAQTQEGRTVDVRIISDLASCIDQASHERISEIAAWNHAHVVPIKDFYISDVRGPGGRRVELGQISDSSELILVSDSIDPLFSDEWPKLTLTEVLRKFEGVAGAIDEASTLGLSHGSITKASLVDLKGNAALRDFGIWWALGWNDAHGSTLSNLPYLDPCLMLNRSKGTTVIRSLTDSPTDTSHRDLYAFALAMVEARLGRLPFAEKDLRNRERLMLAKSEDVFDWGDIPKDEREVFGNVLCADVGKRTIRSAGSFGSR